ncbi:MAG: DUF2637 domain-containing protein [Bifidobacteriaceae bacterium]|nr:DUF2637 domain-containing protein [Bifidobacteriaceae bacterium]
MRKPSHQVSKWVAGTGIAGTVFIAALAFWLSFTALTHLAMRAGIAEDQAWAWPLIVDGIIVVATVSVVAMARRKGSWYPWLLLVSGALVSVTANSIHAAMPAGVNLPPALAAAVSAVPPIVLLAITHLTVVLTRPDKAHAAEGETAHGIGDPPPPAPEPPVMADAAPAAEPQVPRKPRPQRPAGPDKTREWKQARAVEMHRQGETTRSIAAELGVAKATVNRWLASLRQAAPPPADSANEGTTDA